MTNRVYASADTQETTLDRPIPCDRTPRRATACLILIAGMLLTSVDAFAQAPAWHWGTFDKSSSACACHLFARAALQHEQIRILQDMGSVLLGGNGQVIVQIVCMPGGRQITVSAFSADSSAAEHARNNVRTEIMKAQLFDTCP